MRPLSPPPAPRRDPAPSRWAYRWHRWWLSPAFRVMVRLGLPVAVLAAALGGWFSDEGRRAALLAQWHELRTAFENRPEFMVNLVAIDGASPVLAEAIRGDLGLELPQSSFALDLEAIRHRVESYDAVGRAELRLMPGGVLQIGVTERLPALVWRAPDGLWLIDEGGHRVAGIGARSLRGDLPLIAGAAADQAASEALALVAAAGPLVPRLRGLVRLGERRWDLVLDQDQRLMLPAVGAVVALERFLARERAEGLLERAITVVDLRDGRRPTLRLAADAAAQLRQTRLTQTGG